MNEEKRISKVEEEKNIDKENNENVKKTIDIIGKHIDSSKTQEYFNFIKEIRKYRKKINKKKQKLKKCNMLENAYYEKNGAINTEFKDMVENYPMNKIDPWFCSYYSGSGINQKYIPYNFEPGTVAWYIKCGNEAKRYIEQKISSCSRARAKIGEEKIKLNLEFIKEHYILLNTLIMTDILEYYDNELEYWKGYLKEIVEEIDRVEELE